MHGKDAPPRPRREAAGRGERRGLVGTDSARDAVKAKGLEIFRRMGADTPALFDRGWWAGRMMERVMRDPSLKVPLFRFVDVLPALDDRRRIAEHAREYFAEGTSPLPWFVNLLPTAALVKRGVSRFSRTFIAGETPRTALKNLRRLWDEGRPFTADLLGEAVVSEAEAERYRDLYLQLADTLSREVSGWPPPGPRPEPSIPRLHLSVKISSLYSRIGPANHEDSVREVRRRLLPILVKVREAGGFVNLDMETYSLKEITLDVLTETLDDPGFRDWDHAGVALQAYLKCAERDLRRLIGWAKRGDRRITVRLVKGAYLGIRNRRRPAERVGDPRLPPEIAHRREFRAVRGDRPREPRARDARRRLPQRAVDRQGAGDGGAAQGPPGAVRVPDVVRDGGTDQARAPFDGVPGARIRPDRGAPARDGVPGAAPAGKRLERRVPPEGVSPPRPSGRAPRGAGRLPGRAARRRGGRREAVLQRARRRFHDPGSPHRLPRRPRGGGEPDGGEVSRGHRRQGVPAGGTDRLRRPGPPAGGRGDRLRRNAGTRRSRGAGRPRGAGGMGAALPRRAGGGPVPRRVRGAPAEGGARGVAGARSREELAGGGRRRGRGDRLPGVLRPGDAPPGEGRTDGRLPRGGESLPVPSAGRGPRHRAVEFPPRHLARDGLGGAGRRERRPLQAIEPLPRQRLARVLPAAGRRGARRRPEFPPREGGRRGGSPRRPPGGRFRPLHRVPGRGAADRGDGGTDGAGTGVGQAGRRGDGGEERDPGRCGRRPGPGGSGGPLLRVRVPGAEMLRLLPGDRPRGLLRPLPGPAVRGGQGADGRFAGGPRQRDRARHRRRREGEDPGGDRAREARGEGGRGDPGPRRRVLTYPRRS